eukprot:scaffold2107_cov222-Pinguiococcus_pyrenoidosus.AAC.3
MYKLCTSRGSSTCTAAHAMLSRLDAPPNAAVTASSTVQKRRKYELARSGRSETRFMAPLSLRLAALRAASLPRGLFAPLQMSCMPLLSGGAS